MVTDRHTHNCTCGCGNAEFTRALELLHRDVQALCCWESHAEHAANDIDLVLAADRQPTIVVAKSDRAWRRDAEASEVFR